MDDACCDFSRRFGIRYSPKAGIAAKVALRLARAGKLGTREAVFRSLSSDDAIRLEQDSALAGQILTGILRCDGRLNAAR